MEYQTWTRKANAIAAVRKLLADVPLEYVIMSIDAHNVSVAGSEWAVTVEVENPPSDADALQEILGSSARVKALLLEPVPAEAALRNVVPMDAEEQAEYDAVMKSAEKLNFNDDRQHEIDSAHMGDESNSPAKARSSAGRKSEFFGVGLYAEMENPYRAKTLSWRAYDIVQSNPGITLEEFRAKGGQDRTLRHEKRLGRIVTRPLA